MHPVTLVSPHELSQFEKFSKSNTESKTKQTYFHTELVFKLRKRERKNSDI